MNGRQSKAVSSTTAAIRAVNRLRSAGSDTRYKSPASANSDRPKAAQPPREKVRTNAITARHEEAASSSRFQPRNSSTRRSAVASNTGKKVIRYQAKELDIPIKPEARKYSLSPIDFLNSSLAAPSVVHSVNIPVVDCSNPTTPLIPTAAAMVITALRNAARLPNSFARTKHISSVAVIPQTALMPSRISLLPSVETMSQSNSATEARLKLSGKTVLRGLPRHRSRMRAPKSMRLTISVSETIMPGGLSWYLKTGKRLTSILNEKLAIRTTRRIGTSGQLDDHHARMLNRPHKPAHTTATHMSGSVATTASALPSARANRRMSVIEKERMRAG